MTSRGLGSVSSSLWWKPHHAAALLPKLSGVLRVRARPGLHVDDPHLEDVARLRSAHRHRSGADVHAQPLARSAPEERGLHRPGAPPVDTLALPIPVEDRLRPRIPGHHPCRVVVGVVGQNLDGDEVARGHLDQRLEGLAEVPPVHRRVVGGHVVVVGGAGHRARLGRRAQRDHAGRRGAGPIHQRALQQVAAVDGGRVGVGGGEPVVLAHGTLSSKRPDELRLGVERPSGDARGEAGSE